VTSQELFPAEGFVRLPCDRLRNPSGARRHLLRSPSCLEGSHPRSASAQTAVIQEDKSRESVASSTDTNRLGTSRRSQSPEAPEIGDDSWPDRLPTFTRRSATSSRWPGPRPYLRRVGNVEWVSAGTFLIVVSWLATIAWLGYRWWGRRRAAPNLVAG
jgi:hypothetical protein